LTQLLLRKAAQIRSRVAAVRAALPVAPGDVLLDPRLEAFLSFNLFLAIQDAVDLAAHLVAARSLGVPSTQREIFTLLRDAGLLTAASAAAMGQLSSLRNRIAHSYGDVDPVRVVREAPVGLGALEQFVGEISVILTGS
jgi:uncharacterized protein YutE (UPF0331/DUF86 family)